MVYLRKFPQCPGRVWKLRPFPLILLIRKSANAPLVSSGLLHCTYSKAVLYTNTMFYIKKNMFLLGLCWGAVCGLHGLALSMVAASTGHQGNPSVVKPWTKTRGRATHCRSRLENGNVALRRRQGRHLQKWLVTRC